MGGTWILYEYGSSKGYGGDGGHIAVGRTFELVMALALSCNIFLALLGAVYWIHAINFNSSHEDFYLRAVKPLSFLPTLLNMTLWFVSIGLLLGIYLNLSPNWPETIIGISLCILVIYKALTVAKNFFWDTVPLEVYHMPLWGRWQFPQYRRKEGRHDLKVRAKERARELKRRAYCGRGRPDPNFDLESGSANPVSELLRKAAVKLGVLDCDVYVFEARLNESWLFNVDQLKDMSCDALSRFMPFGLAKEVLSMLHETAD